MSLAAASVLASTFKYYFTPYYCIDNVGGDRYFMSYCGNRKTAHMSKSILSI